MNSRKLATNDIMKKIPPKYRNTIVAQELSVKTWKKIFEASGCQDYVKLDRLSHESIATFLCETGTVEDLLIDALETIHTLGEPIGRQLLAQAADGAGIDLAINDDEPDRELAARVWISSRVKNEFLRVLARAQVAFWSVQNTNSFKEFAGRSSFKLTAVDKERIEKKVSKWCVEHNKNSVVDIFFYNIDSIWCWNIVRGDPVKRVVEIKEGSQKELSYRPAVLDHVRVEPETGRIGILSRSSTFIPVYRQVFGQVLTGNDEFFSGENICSLKSLQLKGKELFESDRPLDILRVDVTELRWRRGGSDNFIVKGPDCFRILNDIGAELTVGELIEAKMRFVMAGDSRPVRVKIKIPNKIVVTREEYEPVINRYLDSVGIRGRFDAEDIKNFWSLYPWRHSECFWRKYIGTNFDKLKKNSCFKNIQLEAILPPDANCASGLMAVELVAQNDAIAVSDDGQSLRTLTSSDYEGYKLDLNRISREINRKLQLKNSPRQLTNDLWTLGYRELSDTITAQVYLATQVPSSNTLLQINASLINGYQSVLIFPRDCIADIGCPTVHLDITSFYYEDLIGRIIDSMQLTDKVDPVVWSKADLILDCKRNRVWYKKVQVDGMNVDEHPFKFALIIAEANGTPLSHEAIGKSLSQSEESNTASKAKSDFLKKIEVSYEKNKLEPSKASIDKIFRTSRGHYAMRCSVEIIQ